MKAQDSNVHQDFSKENDPLYHEQTYHFTQDRVTRGNIRS